MSRLERLRSRKALRESQRTSGVRGTICRRQPFFTAAVADERGQVLIWVVMVLALLLGVSAFAVDVGHAMLVRKQLQASADAAALAAAQHLADGTWASVAMTYSGKGTLNGYGGYTLDTPVITTKCSSTVKAYGVACSSTMPNLVIVQETAHVNTFFASVLGFKTLTVNAVSAAAKGARPTPYNVAIVLDTTNSMNLYDSNCGATQEQCAENAIATILGGLDPSIDNVSLFTFPAMEVNSAANDSNCSGRAATGEPYTFPSTSATSLSTMPIQTGSGRSATTIQTTYQITGFLNTYRSSYSAKSLTSSSLLTKAIGQSSGCRGLVPNDTQNTYFAATIYQAQAALDAEQAANPGTANAMIILSDGNATAVNNSYFQDMNSQTTPGPAVDNSTNGIYPSLYGECGQAVDAAGASTAAGTLVFTIAYGSPSTSTGGGTDGNQGNCASDRGHGRHPNITPCQDMQQMSSGWNGTPQNTSHFFSDYFDAAQGDTGCQAANENQTTTNLQDIAEAIVTQLEQVRLISPNAP